MKDKKPSRIVDLTGENGVEKNHIPFLYDLFIYSYNYGDYDGSGFAIWKFGKDWSYGDLGHCSCYGPTENLATDNNAKFTLAKIKKLLKSDLYKNNSHAQTILRHLDIKKITK